jgi:hypothetical protein
MSDLTDYELNHDWTQDPANREKYQGQWVVLRRGELLAYGPDYMELYQRYGSLTNCGNWIVRIE